MLTTIEVTIGKKKVVFPFLITISPGIFPINDHNKPIARKIIPSVMKSFENSIFIQVPPYRNVRKPWASPFYPLAYVEETQFVKGKVHKHLRSYDFLLQS